MRGSTKEVLAILENYPNIVNQIINSDQSALALAIREGHIEIVKALIKAGANLDLQDNSIFDKNLTIENMNSIINMAKIFKSEGQEYLVN